MYRFGLYDRWVDWTVGIALGLVLGVAVVAAFVFLGSEDTVDAPSISGVNVTRQAPALPEGATPPQGPGQPTPVR